MAKMDTIDIDADGVVELTDNDATKLTIQNNGGSMVWIKRGTTSAPADFQGALMLGVGHGFTGMSLDDLFPGANGSRVWAMSEGDGARIAIVHD